MFAASPLAAILSVNTYDKDNNLLHSGTAFYIGVNGEAVADYSVFKGAYRAMVIDNGGKQYDVDCILGADDTYSLVRFRVNTKSNATLKLAASQPLKGDGVYAIRYTNAKKAPQQTVAIDNIELFKDRFAYYTLSADLGSDYIGAPLFNSKGEVVAIVSHSDKEKGYALDINYSKELKIAAIASKASSIALSGINIPKGLPDNAEEALVYVYFKSRSVGNEEYLDVLNRFITDYPKNAEGYYRRSIPLTDMQRFDDADADLQQYQKLAADKLTAYYNSAQHIYNKLTFMPVPAYDKWDYALAHQLCSQATEANDKTYANDSAQHATNNNMVQLLQAQIFSAEQKYDDALAIYDRICTEGNRSPAILYAVSLARESRGDSIADVIEPLDSALALFGTPLPSEAANYVLRRGQMYAQAKRFRESYQDYLQYGFLMNSQVSAVYYYDRSQVALNGRLYQQALDDISSAVNLAPQEPLYLIEKAGICLRVSEFDECIKTCNQALAIEPDNTDALRILGYAQLQKGDKSAALTNLNRASELGDKMAGELIDKYLK